MPSCTGRGKLYGLEIGSCKGQALWEALVVLIAVRAWAPYWMQERSILHAKSDSKAALGALMKERSKVASISFVAREVAMIIAEGAYPPDPGLVARAWQVARLGGRAEQAL